MNMNPVYVFVAFVLAYAYSENYITSVPKWTICPTITAKTLPTTCSSFVQTLNSSLDLVDKFTEIFTKAISEKSNVEVAFDTSVPKHIVSKIGYEIFKHDGQKIGINDPEPGAKLIAETIFELYNKMTPHTHAELIGRSVGQYLMSEGVLTQQNQETLADSFTKSVLSAIGDSHATIFHALRRGVVHDFLLPMGLFTPEKWDTWNSHLIYHAYMLTGNK